MEEHYHNAADDFLELASEQRLNILFNLVLGRSKPSVMARQLKATVQEIHRNFERLADSGLIARDKNGLYGLTTYGKTMCTQVPSLVFLSTNRKYFEDHDFDNLPTKFIQRIGALSSGQHIKGFVKVLEQWKQIYKNANEYIYEVFYEVPLDLIEPLISKIKKGIKFQYIFDESAITPKGRKELLEKLGFRKLVQEGLVERKMKKNVRIIVVLNEKEASVMFPTTDGEVDMGKMFYSDDKLFHEWCLDYFRYCWYGSDVFQESKLKE